MHGRMHARMGALPTVVLTVAVAIALAGCGTTGNTPSGSETGASTAAQTVTALGTGKSSAAPDRADLTFSVVARAATTKGAMGDIAKRSDALVAAFKTAGVGEEDIQTQNLSLNIIRDRKGAISSYEAHVSLRVTARDIAKAGDLLDAGTKAGATEVWGPNLYLSETNEARTKAIDAAVADAKVRAERMAKAAGRTVGEVLSITEQGAVSEYPSKYSYGVGLALERSAVPSVQPGTMDAYANVSVTFELK